MSKKSVQGAGKLLLMTVVIFTSVTFLYSQNFSELLPDTIRSCRVDSLKLDAGQGFGSYLWSTGDTTSIIYIKNSGGYWVNFTSGDTINETDTTWVIILDAAVAFRDSTLLCGDTIDIYGDNGDFRYIWSPDNDTALSLSVFPRDTITYFVYIEDTVTGDDYCFDSVQVTVDPVVIIDTVKQLNMSCKDEANTKVLVEASGGYPPYLYEWSEGDGVPGSPLVLGLADGEVSVTVTDTIGCFNEKTFIVKAYPVPDLEIITDPGDTVYYQKPYVKFSFNNLSYDSLPVDTFRVASLQWDFGDESTAIEPVVLHPYEDVGDYPVVLSFKTFYGCPGTDSVSIKVKPVDLKIPTVLTPNGDGKNDTFIIDENEEGGGSAGPAFKNSSEDFKPLDTYYESTTLIIFNSWGKKILQIDNYENDWTPDNLSDGTYYYLLKCEGYHGSQVYRGTFMILGSGINN